MSLGSVINTPHQNERLRIIKTGGSVQDTEGLESVMKIISNNTAIRIGKEFFTKNNKSSCTAEKYKPNEEEIYLQITQLFRDARNQEFESGMDSDFSTELENLIKEFGNSALIIIADIIIEQKTSPEIAKETLRSLGFIYHSPTHPFRLWLLEKSLNNPSNRVRDGAILGLSHLDDPDAIEFLRVALPKEEHSRLRKDMEQLMVQLENTSNAVSSSKDRAR